MINAKQFDSWDLHYIIQQSRRKEKSASEVPVVAQSFKGLHVVEESEKTDYRFRMDCRLPYCGRREKPSDTKVNHA